MKTLGDEATGRAGTQSDNIAARIWTECGNDLVAFKPLDWQAFGREVSPVGHATYR